MHFFAKIQADSWMQTWILNLKKSQPKRNRSGQIAPVASSLYTLYKDTRHGTSRGLTPVLLERKNWFSSFRFLRCNESKEPEIKNFLFGLSQRNAPLINSDQQQNFSQEYQYTIKRKGYENLKNDQRKNAGSLMKFTRPTLYGSVWRIYM